MIRKADDPFISLFFVSSNLGEILDEILEMKMVRYLLSM